MDVMNEAALYDIGFFARGFSERFTAAVLRYCMPENQGCTFREALVVLADQTGVTVSEITAWSLGVSVPSVYSLQAFCWQTDTSVVWMLFGNDLTPQKLEARACELNHPLHRGKK